MAEAAILELGQDLIAQLKALNIKVDRIIVQQEEMIALLIKLVKV